MKALRASDEKKRGIYEGQGGILGPQCLAGFWALSPLVWETPLSNPVTSCAQQRPSQNSFPLGS